MGVPLKNNKTFFVSHVIFALGFFLVAIVLHYTCVILSFISTTFMKGKFCSVEAYFQNAEENFIFSVFC